MSRPRIKLLALIAALLWLAGTGRAVRAHPADMFFQEHTITLSPAGLQITWSIYPGGLLVPAVWQAADSDQDQAVTPAEARAWLEPHVPEFSASLDEGPPLSWQIESIEWPASMEPLLGGQETIRVHLAAGLPANLTGSHQLIFHNRYEEAISINWFYLHGVEGVSFETPEQINGRLEVNFFIPEAANPVPGTARQTGWDSGIPSLPPLVGQLVPDTVAGEGEARQPQDSRPDAILTGLVRTPDLSANFYLAALVIAVVLGALHALTPGHGKTVVAAYLVGARGTAWHAINLGAIVTLTHTGSVFLLGLLTLFASQYILPDRLLPVLEVASGLLIIGFGAHLLYRRWRAWRDGPSAGHHDHHHSHTPPHHHHHDHPYDHSHDDHHHHHNHEDHHHHLPDEVTWRSLLALGISGGLVPCPDAIAILLVALAINRLAFGLSLIVAFSLGLALVLIVIGLAMVHSRRLFEKMDTFSRLAPVMPLVSAIVVLGLGIWLTAGALAYTISITEPERVAATAGPAGPTPGRARPVEPVSAAPGSTPFRPDQAGILYVAPDEQERSQLFRIDGSGGEPAALTQEPISVQDYAISPDGKMIAYTAARERGQSGLSLLRLDGLDPPLQLACPSLTCGQPIWSPDGQRLIYEMFSQPTPDAPAELPSLWSLDVATEEAEPVFQDHRWPGLNARWSPDGQWLSYVYPGSGKIEIYNLEDGRRYSLPNLSGAPASWSPGGEYLLLTDQVGQEDRPGLIHLFRFEIATEALIDLSEQASPGEVVMDTAAAWSPDGAWITVVRREVTETGAVVGSQLWLMGVDGSQARSLTTEPKVTYGTPAWSPDGTHLLFHRYFMAEPGKPPAIWRLNIETGEMKEIINPGNRPAWIIP